MTRPEARRIIAKTAKSADSLALKAKITARSERPRSYRFINGLGHEYRAEALSCIDAMADIGRQLRMSVGADKIEVIENGGWVRVL